MVIASSNIEFEASHYIASNLSERLSFRIISDERQNRFRGDILDISTLNNSSKISDTEYDSDDMLTPEMRAVKLLFREIFGDKFDINLSDYSLAQSKTEENNRSISADLSGKNLEIFRSVSLYEAEKTSLKASGIIKTADGKELDFNITFSISREFYKENIQTIRTARQSDPLVINIDTNAAELSSRKINFDINSDGTAENISIPGRGSAFLFIDKDGDNQATDGSELFGPATGSGFDELRSFDKDNNNWIDEKDRIFPELSLWNAAAGTVSKLKNEGIGAIYLNSGDTPFAYRPNFDTENGFLRRTGIYVRDDGSVSTVQELDLSL